MSDIYTNLLNQILNALKPQLNNSIGNAIREKGLDPYAKVASGSYDFDIGTAYYSVTNLTGLASTIIQSLQVSSVSGSGSNLTGVINFCSDIRSLLETQVGGSVHVLFTHPSITGNVTFEEATASGNADFSTTIHNNQICLNSINVISVDFNYLNPNIDIDGSSIIKPILNALGNLILDAVKGNIRTLISGEVKDVLNQQINALLPQCYNLSANE